MSNIPPPIPVTFWAPPEAPSTNQPSTNTITSIAIVALIPRNFDRSFSPLSSSAFSLIRSRHTLQFTCNSLEEGKKIFIEHIIETSSRNNNAQIIRDGIECSFLNEYSYNLSFNDGETFHSAIIEIIKS